MITSQATKQHSDFKPDLTPLLDIIFIVMVFLLLTANASIKTLEVDVPTTSDTATLTAIEKTTVTVNILDESPRWAIDGKRYQDWDAFNHALIALMNGDDKPDLVIAADKHAAIEHMMRLLTFLQQHEITTTRILMEEQQ